MAASGDSRAFAAIYERYHQPIYRYCHSIVHDPDDAADALQNAMLKAMRGLEGDARDIALKPWLFRIAHNEAISLIRRRRPMVELEDSNGPVAHAVEEDAATRERVQQLVSDLRELPERQRGALLMRELAGLEFSEIGDAFGVSPAAAKQTVYEARSALHEYVEGRRMRCDEARQSLSAGDRRMLRGRKLSAHLRDCSSCRDFEEIMRLRRRDVAVLAPPISAGTSAAVLQGVLGGGGTGAAGGGGVVAWLSGAGKALLGSHSVQSLFAAAAITASAGALGLVTAMKQDSAPAAAPSAPAAHTSRGESTAAPAQSGTHPHHARARHAKSGGGRSSHARSHSVPATGGSTSGTASPAPAGSASGSQALGGSAGAAQTSAPSGGSGHGNHPIGRTVTSVIAHVNAGGAVVSDSVAQAVSTTTALSDLPQPPPLP